MDWNCSLCRELDGEEEPLHQLRIPEAPANRILLDFKHWVAVPTIGPLCRGHILLVSKRHIPSVLAASEAEYDDFEKLLFEAGKKLNHLYGKAVIFFEHGMSDDPRFRVGGCIAHAHLHLLPIVSNFIKLAQERIPDWEGASTFRALFQQNIRDPYLLVGSGEGDVLMHPCFEPLPSQILRQLLSESIKKTNWDWRDSPNASDFLQTLHDWNNSNEKIS